MENKQNGEVTFSLSYFRYEAKASLHFFVDPIVFFASGFKVIDTRTIYTKVPILK